MGGLQRSVTGAEFDHVGLVVPNAFKSETLQLLESTAEGCTVYPLLSRLRAYDHGFVEYMAVRRLHGVGEAGGEARRLLNRRIRAFASRADGMPYGFSFGKLFQRRELDESGLAATATWPSRSNGQDLLFSSADLSNGTGSSGTGSSGTESSGASSGASNGADSSSTSSGQSSTSGPGWGSFTLPPRKLDLDLKKTFFCSELVAAAQLEAGILRPNLNMSYFWPGSFAAGGDVDGALAEGLSYGPEILLDCREVEVGRAEAYW